MNGKVVAVLLAAILCLGGGFMIGRMIKNSETKSRTLGDFDVQEQQMAKDLEGFSVGLPYGQVWAFDPTQNIVVKALGKKRAEEFVAVAAEISALAKVQQEEKIAPKVQSSTDPIKSTAKEQPKLPESISLSGVAKLHYEKIGDKWYLVNIESVSLKVRSD